MATRTMAQSGRASVAATWADSTPPVDNDAIDTSNAAYHLEWDIDSSGWANGIAGISGPGSIGVYLVAGSYPLKMKSGSNITCNIAFGEPTQGIKWPITFQANADYIKSTSVTGRCAEPTTKSVLTNGATLTATTEVPIDTDLTGETDYWAVGARVAVSDPSTNTAANGILNTIAAVSATHLTLSSGIGIAGTGGIVIALLTRNVEVISPRASGTTGLIQIPVGGTFDASLSIGNAGGTAVKGVGIRADGVYALFNMPGGSVWNFGANLHTLQSGGVIAATFALSGNGLGCLTLCRDLVSDGSIYVGNTTALAQNSERILLRNGFDVGRNAFNSCGPMTVESTFSHRNRNAWAFLTGPIECAGDVTATDYLFKGNRQAIFRGCQLTSAIGINNGTGMYANARFYGCELAFSPTQVAEYLGDPSGMQSVISYDPQPAGGGSPQRGRLQWWSPGGFGASTAMVPDDPPVPMDYVHRAECGSATRDNWVVVPLFGRAGVKLQVTVYFYIAAGLPEDFDVPPTIEILDPGKGSWEAAAVLASAVAGDHPAGPNGWYTEVLEYTPDRTGEFTFRFRARDNGGVVSWYPVFPSELAEAVFPAEANVEIAETAYGPTGDEYAGSLDLATEKAMSELTGAAVQLALDQAAVSAKKSYIYPNADLLGVDNGELRASNIGTLAGTDDLVAADLRTGKTVDNVAGSLVAEGVIVVED